MKHLSMLSIWILMVCSFAVSAKSLELPEIQVIPIVDSATDRQYELYVKLPEKYAEEKERRFPVIYYTDAMWHVELLSSAASYIYEDVILVGISWQQDDQGLTEGLRAERGEHVSRYRDYSFTPSENEAHQRKYRFGGGENHLSFIRNDVIKFVENQYRTDENNRTYFGYSMGGEFGTYILLTQSDIFKNYILGSPSVRGEVPHIAELVEAAKAKDVSFNANVFMSYGTLETEASKHIDDLFNLLNKFKDSGLSLKLTVVEGDHAGAFPATGIQSVAWLKKLVSEGEKG